MNTYRVAIVGLGRMGSTIDDEVQDEASVTLPYSIASTCRASERLELVAGSDLRLDRRDAFRERWGVEALYEDYLEMVARERPDIVAICTTATGLDKPGNRAPSAEFRGDSHAELTTALAEAGVPMLYVEKAMACSMAAADEALAACQKSGARINVGVLRRFHPAYQQMKAVIDRGDIGEPASVVHFGASSLMHGHIHSIDTISYLLGDPGIDAVRGELEPEDAVHGNMVSADPRARFDLKMSNGVGVSSVPAGTIEVEVLGSEGSVRALNNNSSITLRRTATAGGRRARWEDATAPEWTPRSAVLNCMEDLVDAHETDRPALADAKQSHGITEACIAVAESHRQGGGWVSLPMANRDLYVFHV